MVEQVKQEILAAFAVLEIPKAEDLIKPFTGDEAGERKIQSELSETEWINLDTKFLAERWASFCYLSAKGYRYYLPALLMRCLENFSEENILIHSTVFSLQPSFWDLYYCGKDESFQYQISLFNTGQYQAVCSFLGLVFDSFPHMRYQSSKALKWGWNRQEDHLALAKCRDFYFRLHHYQYPLVNRPQVSDLVEQIKLAFDRTPYPGDNRLCGSDQGDEPAEYAMEFRGLNWRTLHPEFLDYNHASLSFFSDEAFRYFLPAYLIADLMRTNFNANPVFHLTHGLVSDEPFQVKMEDVQINTFDWHQIAVHKFSHFTFQERQAIVSYLRYRATDSHSKEEINQALKNYWLRMLS